MSERTARERFVEAMRCLAEKESMYLDPKPIIRQAVEAFADAECRERVCLDRDHWGDAGVCVNDDLHSKEQHAACRAALRRECGLEE